MSLDTMRRVLEASVARNGEKPLTNAYLLNIVKVTQRVEAREAELQDKFLNEVLEEDRKWGSS